MHFINLHITSNFVLSDRAHVGGIIRGHLGHVHLLTVQSVYKDACFIMELGERETSIRIRIKICECLYLYKSKSLFMVQTNQVKARSFIGSMSHKHLDLVLM